MSKTIKLILNKLFGLKFYKFCFRKGTNDYYKCEITEHKIVIPWNLGYSAIDKEWMNVIE